MRLTSDLEMPLSHPIAATSSSILRVETPETYASINTANRARSNRRRGSRSEEKKLPLRKRGMRSALASGRWWRTGQSHRPAHPFPCKGSEQWIISTGVAGTEPCGLHHLAGRPSSGKVQWAPAKTGKESVVPLTPLVLDVLREH